MVVMVAAAGERLGRPVAAAYVRKDSIVAEGKARSGFIHAPASD